MWKEKLQYPNSPKMFFWDFRLGYGIANSPIAVNAAYCRSLGDSPFFIYRGKDPELPATRFAKPRFSYAESLSFEQERQRREHQVMELVKEKLLEAADENCRQVQKKCKEKTLQIDDRVFLRTCIMYLIGISSYLISLSVARCHLYSKMFSWVKLKKNKKKIVTGLTP